jgi:hypothetical protein
MSDRQAEQFPQNPIHGQQYRDDFGARWVYDIATNSWILLGVDFNLPLARSGNKCEEQ